jgi:hypothetical protein
MRRAFATSLAALLLTGAAPLAAQTTSGIGAREDCVSELLYLTRIGELGAARVTAAGQTHFLHDREGRPCDRPACVQKAYVVAGDVVVTGHRVGGFVCVLYPNKLGGTEGWLPATALAPLAPVPLKPGDWSGVWLRDTDTSLTLRAAGAAVAVKGDAVWYGLGDNVHTGEVNGRGVPRGDTLQALDVEDPDPEGCAPVLRRLGPYLVAFDRKRCGGVNVNFIGVFRRR